MMALPKAGIIFNDIKPAAARAAAELTEKFQDAGYRVYQTTGWGGILGFPRPDSPVCHTPIDRLAAEGFDEAMPFAIVLGGDGTVLAAARQVAPFDIPLLTINTGHMGFLTEGYLNQIHPAIDTLLAGQYALEDRSMIEVRVFRDERLIWEALALNEAVLHKEPLSGICHFEVAIGRHNIVDIAADGVIVATPTGSTAYALSAGGPVITPDVQVLQLIPICPHSLAARGLVFADTESLVVHPPTNHQHLILSLDGNSGCYIWPGDQVRIRRARYRTRLIRLQPPEFFALLREKLGWGLPHIAKPLSVELP
ncbi:NAD(+) kinase [Gloeobacter violaceus]|uniref:NAD kinase 2 n=1 Tax=Gloeobacter violaceus (strain ATCC 29082 / PCC 7421) TaxID=251221 RepID=NADK2_GLOVI|nr:NAD(+) kinase [Gloeobacter violaceus]Q7NFK0.1 RecName: Full=NAD kinase 2; AltName: Full=ATP-dependent NAD kinase 2 [Gloeobacter violaceus PCC 7421]BAC91466.1 gll3525 [Gloeobacter violaceus PCC 7421]